MNSLKIIFAGTPDFAVLAMESLHEANYKIVGVLTQPDRPSGRGLKLNPSPVKVKANQLNIPVYQPSELKSKESYEALAAVDFNVMIVAAYGLIIPQSILDLPSLGCFNIHASLLPRWRGAAPIHRAILMGDEKTGVTIMRLVQKLDAGDMVKKVEVKIDKKDTTEKLTKKLAKLGAHLMTEVINELIEKGTLQSIAQDEASVTYAEKVTKEEAKIDWEDSAIVIARKIHAFNAYPIAQTQYHGKICKIWDAEPIEVIDVEQTVKAGQFIKLDESIYVKCGEGVLLVKELQMPNGKRLHAKDFIAGYRLTLNDSFKS
ncbi:MAG: methionyl-tRNA formyltransferase [Candidatus Methylopumilus sp.]|nr:methionyl-tRNA formyltransferase [Candidatus Methylopumilus sp.]